MAITDHDRIPEIALSWHRDGKGAALATVVQTWGSAPRQVGAQLAISGGSEIMGSVSGGCVEGAVVVEALDAIGDGRCRILEFGVSDAEAFAVGLACGGTIRVLVEPVGIGDGVPEGLLAELVAARAARRPAAVATDTATWTRRLLAYADAPARFDADRSGFLDDDAPQTFLAVHNPPLRLAIVGAAHIAQPLTLMARAAGYDVTVIDPREAFASETRFPGEAVSHDWPDEALRAHGLDLRTALVTLSHDPKIDDPALVEALRSDVFYIGALGSTRTHAKRVDRLRAAGFSEAEIARIEAPIGLDIGAKSPAEIAIAILAQMTERLRRPDTRPGARPGVPPGAADMPPLRRASGGQG
ncbi:XdhC family protein [Limibaculum sp. M0105]|uniref:XdhC family protein n=1 Tax=Thermohalobaculum xanthum TaxID=2753746 RepID=A0A8J7SAM1_9RHOB|nr:XdhC/CoxI family protein [Thermohalobaculum xanthum]MBK0398432.1 XdhC family protein [Thermohalobaculum xanthum]